MNDSPNPKFVVEAVASPAFCRSSTPWQRWSCDIFPKDRWRTQLAVYPGGPGRTATASGPVASLSSQPGEEPLAAPGPHGMLGARAVCRACIPCVVGHVLAPGKTRFTIDGVVIRGHFEYQAAALVPVAGRREAVSAQRLLHCGGGRRVP